MVICGIVLRLTRVFLEMNVTVVSCIIVHQNRLPIHALGGESILESHWSWAWFGQIFFGQRHVRRSDLDLFHTEVERARAFFLTPFPPALGTGRLSAAVVPCTWVAVKIKQSRALGHVQETWNMIWEVLIVISLSCFVLFCIVLRAANPSPTSLIQHYVRPMWCASERPTG